MSDSSEPRFYCEGCQQDLFADEYDDHELCRRCMRAAEEQAYYRPWVSSGG